MPPTKKIIPAIPAIEMPGKRNISASNKIIPNTKNIMMIIMSICFE
jgi:hypothetical protein